MWATRFLIAQTEEQEQRLGGNVNWSSCQTCSAQKRRPLLLGSGRVETNLWALCESSSVPAYEPELALRGAWRQASDSRNDA